MGTGNKAEMVIAICAVVTSAIAVFIAWDQGRVMRAQQHGSVFPVLQVDGFVSTTETERSLGIRFSNSGVGPALVESVDALKDGQPVDGLAPFLEKMPEGYDLSWTSMLGRAVAPGDEALAVDIKWPVGAISHGELMAASEEWAGVSLAVCYCSVFHRCWKTLGVADNRRERVKACRRGEQDIFADLAPVAQASDEINPELE